MNILSFIHPDVFAKSHWNLSHSLLSNNECNAEHEWFELLNQIWHLMCRLDISKMPLGHKNQLYNFKNIFDFRAAKCFESEKWLKFHVMTWNIVHESYGLLKMVLLELLFNVSIAIL